jgi:predicted AAA+ superfamily ATPase
MSARRTPTGGVTMEARSLQAAPAEHLAVREMFVFAQLRYRERRAGRARSLFYGRDRKREVDLVVESAGFPHGYPLDSGFRVTSMDELGN